ncbi:MAG: hypothetical protein QNJ40_07945 [Xanthomonadales bacterium]|nr:hypothetical protein [Xanthomonadales bacterium]
MRQPSLDDFRSAGLSRVYLFLVAPLILAMPGFAAELQKGAPLPGAYGLLLQYDPDASDRDTGGLIGTAPLNPDIVQANTSFSSLFQ